MLREKLTIDSIDLRLKCSSLGFSAAIGDKIADDALVSTLQNI
tara:strand:- start:98 stop:226 length:129 start_codon:yes stop_codon:yes gene_type:complete